MSPRTARRTRSKLDREAVIDAALRLADDEGLEAVSIRRLADRFEVTPMALYWHFEDKEALLASLADRLWQEVAATLDHSLAQAPAGTEDDWDFLRLVLDALVEVMRGHPAVADLVPERVMSSEAGLSVAERTLGFLARRGLGPEPASDLGRFVLCSAVMLVTNQPGIEIPGAAERAEHQRQKRIALASLPPERYPNVIACASYLTDCEAADSYFTRGLEVILAGVRVRASEA